ncbi:MAG: hypothetical protein ABIN96_12090 [Rubrivivax sp.]
MRKRYKRRPERAVTAVQMTLDFDGLSYTKWGGSQRGKRGDWLVDNQGDVYTVDADSFAATYSQQSPGRWLKTAPVWAEQATAAGQVATKEGHTQHQAGDWLVSNREDGSDSYAVSAAKFNTLYEPDPEAG